LCTILSCGSLGSMTTDIHDTSSRIPPTPAACDPDLKTPIAYALLHTRDSLTAQHQCVHRWTARCAVSFERGVTQDPACSNENTQVELTQDAEQDGARFGLCAPQQGMRCRSRDDIDHSTGNSTLAFHAPCPCFLTGWRRDDCISTPTTTTTGMHCPLPAHRCQSVYLSSPLAISEYLCFHACRILQLAKWWESHCR
jgi:hypothetical protein